jgi:hypothetical protein
MKITFTVLLYSLVVAALSTNPMVSRRAALFSGLFTPFVSVNLVAKAAGADCFDDCLKNCKLIAPKDTAYCNDNCSSYCAQEGRTDGLSGSVSAANGETGMLGFGTTVKGADHPPVVKLPGLDFTKSEAGRKLIGY